MENHDPYWYKDAIIYQTHIKAFRDGNGDGVGDFQGLIEKLDYIHDLGVTAIWLLPFYPSPFRDDGYDISDYRNIHPSYGAMRDFRRFVRMAHERGLRVITELVINHTSDQHPWFQRARKAKRGSTYRDFYVWNDDEEKYRDARIIFLDTEKSNWAWDSEAQSYYWHRFYHHQPDLNFDNPRVIREVFNVMRYWLDTGVDGLRLDAIPYLRERDGTNCENLPETHELLKQLRKEMDSNYEDRMLLAEANQWPEDVRPYFGDGDECHVAFHFPLMPRMFMSIAQEDRHPITDILRQTPDIPETCQWAVFLRNHDELTLEMVTDRERDYLWQYYAADPRARINLGIRRRLAPLMENDRRRIELMNSLLMSMPGTPVIYYGDEIGMGDNVYLGDRDGVRTPMQWSPDRNAGFSSCDPQRLYLPPIMDPIYGYGTVNVESAQRSSTSLLNWMKRLIRQHQARSKTFGRGTIKFLYPSNRKILAYLREYEGESILCVANLSRSAQPVGLDLSEYRGRTPVELLGQTAFPPIGELYYLLTLPPYGFYWFLLADEVESPVWSEGAVPLLPELGTLVVPEGWRSLASGRPRQQLEGEALRDYIGRQRWFASKGTAIEKSWVTQRFELAAKKRSWLVSTVRLNLEGDRTEDYFVPLAFDWEAEERDPVLVNLWNAMARIRRGPKVGLLTEAVADPDFIRAVVGAMARNTELSDDKATLRFWKTQAFPEDAAVDDLDVRPLGAEQSNTSMLAGDDMILKAFRKLHAGIHPEVEMGRFLTDVAGYQNTPPLLGAVEQLDADGTPTSLFVLQKLIPNQGDGWRYTLNYLERFLDGASTQRGLTEAPGEEVHGAYIPLAEQLGKRVGELHQALTAEGGGEAFTPEPVTAVDIKGWRGQIRKEASETLGQLKSGAANLEDEQRALVNEVLGRKQELLHFIDNLELDHGQMNKTRFHGDLHLGQVLVVQHDFYIIDFEGEPGRTFSERRSKHSPLRDVAGMLRSFNYAGWSASFAFGRGKREDVDWVQQAMMEWESAASDGFLRSYRLAMEGCTSCPPDLENMSRLLDLFILEKALYEVRYELANRPSWLKIPLSGILTLLTRYTGR